MIENAEMARRAADWAGHPLNDTAVELLERYATWLKGEAIPAGGLGPREGERIWSRHIADSLLFGAAWSKPPVEILDVGSGVGLPGIPLAIMFPETTVTLLDRGGRRIRLLQRLEHILELPNLHIFQGDIFSVEDSWSGVVFRGSVKAPEAVGLSAKLLAEQGVSVLGLSRRAEEPPQARDLIGIATAMGIHPELVEVPPDVLDGAAWLLIMRDSGKG